MRNKISVSFSMLCSMMLSLMLCLVLSAQPMLAYQQPDMTLYSKAMLLYDTTTDTVIYESNRDAIMYPASLTKIMSALVVLENTTNLHDTVTITPAMLAGLTKANASVAGYVSGEVLTIEQLLYGLLLPSGADAANALSIYVAGSVDQFVGMMNALADRLGMTQTHFVNPTGLDHIDQVTSAQDMLTLFNYALSFEVFRSIISTNEYVFTTNKHPGGMELLSSMLVGKDESSSYYSPYIQGGKTGYTGKAGRCLASYGSFDDMEFILISLNAPFEGFTKPSRSFYDAQVIYDWAFERFYHTTIAKQDELIKNVNIKQSWTRSLDVVWQNDVVLLLDRYATDEPVFQLDLQDTYVAPIAQGANLGEVQYIYEGKTIYKQKIVNEALIKHSTIVEYAQAFGGFIYQIRYVLLLIGLLFVLLFGLRAYNIAKFRRTMAKRLRKSKSKVYRIRK